MFYVVERYLPGLSRTDLLPGLSKLELAIEELRDEGTVVRYLGSTVVLGDEACFCQLEGPSEEAVAEANRRAGLPFDRIVPALLVHSTHRSHDMSISTSVPQTARLGRSRIVIAAVLAAVVAVTAWAVATYAGGSGSHAAPTQASVLSTLTPQQQQYVLGVAAMTPTQIAAAFGTGRPSGDSAVLSSLTAQQRRYVQAIASMSYAELAAAFGTGK
jgi:hypothetical protein